MLVLLRLARYYARSCLSSMRRPPPASTLFPYTTLFRSHLHQDEVIERPQEAGFRDPLRLAGRVHVHDRRPPDHRVGGVDRPVEVVPGVAEEGLVGVQLGRVVVDTLVTAVGALGVDVRAELRPGEAPRLR